MTLVGIDAVGLPFGVLTVPTVLGLDVVDVDAAADVDVVTSVAGVEDEPVVVGSVCLGVTGGFAALILVVGGAAVVVSVFMVVVMTFSVVIVCAGLDARVVAF